MTSELSATSISTPAVEQGAGKHTPGPWDVFSNPLAIGVTSESFDVAVMLNSDTLLDSNRNRLEHEANARLISAAPELLEALQWAMLVGRLDYHQRIKGQNEDYCDAVDRARAAIAKATGSTA